MKTTQDAPPTAAIAQTMPNRTVDALDMRCGIHPGTAQQPTVLVVAVSGGADSVALLRLLAAADVPGYALHAAHFDHGLRPASEQDAAFVADVAADLGTPCHRGCAAPGALTADGDNLEQAARRARYAFLLATAQGVTPAGQTPVVLTAHHALDQAETILLHLVRGSGLTGLRGMAWSATMRLGDFTSEDDLRPVTIARPLLDVMPDALEAYLQQTGASWRTDSTNADLRLARNRLRQAVLPTLLAINPRFVAAVGRMADVVSDDVERLNELDRAQLGRLLAEPLPPESIRPHAIVLDLAGLLALSRSEQRGVLRQALGRLRNGLYDLSFATVEMFLDALARHRHAGGPHPLIDDVVWTVAGYDARRPLRLSLHEADWPPFACPAPQLPVEQPPTSLRAGESFTAGAWTLDVRRLPRDRLPSDWRSGDQPWRAFLDAESVGSLQVVALAHLPPGQRLAPLGMDGRHKQIGDLMTDRKTPAAQRPGWPLIIDGTDGTILWVCGLQPGHRARITPTTQQVIELVWRPNSPPGSAAAVHHVSTRIHRDGRA